MSNLNSRLNTVGQNLSTVSFQVTCNLSSPTMQLKSSDVVVQASKAEAQAGGILLSWFSNF